MEHPRKIYAESPDELAKSLENPAMDIRERELRTNALIIAKLRSIEKPHWTQVPSFWLLVVSVLLTAAALVVAFVGLPQAQSPASVTAPSTQKAPSESSTPSSSPLPLPSSTALQLHKPQK